MLKNQAGFAHLGLVLLAVAVLSAGALAGWNTYKSHKAGASQRSTQSNAGSAQNDQPLPLKSIGFNLDYYDPSTNHAGDMVFTHEDHDLSGNFHFIFADFGTQDLRSPNDATKRNVQPTFVLPLGTKVHSLVDGVVVEVKTLYSNDYTIWVARSAGSQYIYETEHVDNPIVKKGDRVQGGQVIGEVSTHDSQYHPGFGIVEIGILRPSGSQAQHICPFHYLDPSIKAAMGKKILSVHQAWMSYVGIPTLYNDAHSAEPGCTTLEPITG